MCETMDMGIEGLHTETGAGVLEAALRVSDGLEAADKAALFKLFTKVLAQKRDWLATFMAKWSKDWPGCGGHMHMSLWKDGKPVFFDEKAPHRMSKTMRQFVGGQQALMPELLGMVASTVNAYRRLIPGFWAPTVSAWGVENRTCALRVIPGSAKSTRVEYRIAAADANPYLALAAAIGSGLWGIENKLDPGEPIAGNSYEKKHPAKCAAAAHADGSRPAGSKRRRRRAICSAMPSSIIILQRVNGKSGSSARPSRNGSSTATWKSSDGVGGQLELPDLDPLRRRAASRSCPMPARRSASSARCWSPIPGSPSCR